MEKQQGDSDHVLVCLSTSPSNKKTIEAAARMADAFGAKFTALYVQRVEPDVLSDENRIRLQNNIRFAEDNGATIATVVGDNVPFQIAEYARISGVNKIVIGRSNTRKYSFLSGAALTEQLIAIAPNIDIYIIPDSSADWKMIDAKHLTKMIRPSGRDILLTVLLLAGVTLLGSLFRRLGFTESNIITVYILGVLVNAIITRSHFSSLISSFCSVLLFNYFFTEPRLTFHAYEPGYTITFAIMLLAAILTGSLANKLKDAAKQSARAAYRTKVLFDTNQLLQKAQSDDEVIRITASQVMLLLDRDLVIYPVENHALGKGYIFRAEGESDSTIFFEERENQVAEWVFAHQKRAGATTDIFSDARGLYLAIRINGSVYGVMGIRVDKTPVGMFEYSILMSILGECALALENMKNAREKEQAALQAQKEKMRSNLLRTISHDLRTPLTSISGNASNLCSHYEQLDADTRQQMFMDIYDDAQWLINLVENLLSVTRIENNSMELNLSPQLVDDVIEEALKHIDRNRTRHTIRVQQGDEMLFAIMDAKLIVQVIINIVNNAIKYTQVGSEIVITSGERDDKIFIEVSDNGPGIRDEAKEHIFDMFYTVGKTVADSKRSIGLGLALCKTVVEAHGGCIMVKDNIPSGCVFTFYLQKGEININE
ncbi:MAG: DUF4118 domain-containing protein [Lachnospiraceae bacterium]|nr:DUF4118 domain-containing protein [Lachnospiraceae bacterium]